jgi:hypothetical protein
MENPIYPIGPKKIEVLGETKFFADGSLVRAETKLTMQQLKLIMKFVEQTFQERAQKQQGAPKK